MPRATPTSSFDSPCAISSTTCLCRDVIPDGSLSACMTRGYGRDRAATIGRRVYPGSHWGVRAPRDERRLVPARVRRTQLVGVECADPLEHLQFGAEVDSHHLRAVRCDRELNAMLDERPECLAHRVLVRECLGEQVRGGADLERDVRVAERRHQVRVARGEDPVADAIGTQRLDHLRQLLDAVDATLFADVDRDAEPRVARKLDLLANLGVVVPRAVRTWAGDVDTDYTAGLVL